MTLNLRELSSDQRLRYRSSPPSDLFSVTAIDLEGSKVSGHVIDVSAGGIALSFGRQVATSYRVGETVWMHMKSPHLASPLVAPTQVIRRLACDWCQMYGFRFVDWLGLLSQIPPELAGLFNQRRHCRVDVGPDRPIEVSIEEGLVTSSWAEVFGGLKGVLRDVSSRGLSFRVDGGVEMRTTPSESVKVSFTLPGSDESMTFWIEIVRWEADAEGFSCGAVFDTERTEQFTAKRDALVRGLEQRQVS